jgi:hypothetical protein
MTIAIFLAPEDSASTTLSTRFDVNDSEHNSVLIKHKRKLLKPIRKRRTCELLETETTFRRPVALYVLKD